MRKLNYRRFKESGEGRRHDLVQHRVTRQGRSAGSVNLVAQEVISTVREGDLHSAYEGKMMMGMFLLLLLWFAHSQSLPFAQGLWISSIAGVLIVQYAVNNSWRPRQSSPGGRSLAAEDLLQITSNHLGNHKAACCFKCNRLHTMRCY